MLDKRDFLAYGTIVLNFGTFIGANSNSPPSLSESLNANIGSTAQTLIVIFSSMEEISSTSFESLATISNSSDGDSRNTFHIDIFNNAPLVAMVGCGA